MRDKTSSMVLYRASGEGFNESCVLGLVMPITTQTDQKGLTVTKTQGMAETADYLTIERASEITARDSVPVDLKSAWKSQYSG